MSQNDCAIDDCPTLKYIAEELGVHPKTVSRALKRGGASNKMRKKRGSKLDSYKAAVDILLKCGVWNAVVILREIQVKGCTGGYTILQEYIQPKRALRSGKAVTLSVEQPVIGRIKVKQCLP
jgi:transposase